MMVTARRLLVTAVVVSLIAGGSGRVLAAQDVVPPGADAPGSLTGTVKDERGLPVQGVEVSARGRSTLVVLTDRDGRFRFDALVPGPYLVRAQHAGFVGRGTQVVAVAPSSQAVSSLAIRRIGSAGPILAAGAAGIGEVGAAPAVEPPGAPSSAQGPRPQEPGETAWRMRHARRSVLKDIVLPVDVVAEAGRTPPFDGDLSLWNPSDTIGRGVGAPFRAASSFFADSTLSGQINLLTTSSFDGPEQLFSRDNLARNMAYVHLGAPVGSGADWAARGMVTRADIAAWMLSGSYRTRAPAQHRYDVGMSYSTQRYDGGNLLALRDVAYGSRNAGSVHAYDRFSVSPNATLTYGAAFRRYDYLDDRSQLSPRVELSVRVADGLHVTGSLTRQALAPGAEEFLPPDDQGLWLPPQRTFSSFEFDRSFRAERATTGEVSVEREFGSSTIAFRAFRQHVDDQLVTIFGADSPERSEAKPGHYLVGSVGDVDAVGYGAALRTVMLRRIRSSVEYSITDAEILPSGDLHYLMLVAPSAVRERPERIHNLSASVDAEVPETATRVVVLYRLGSGFAHPRVTADEPAGVLGGRFDIQVRQSLPFMNFSSARWEMLLAVRNFFRDAGAEQSVYDELMVVRPPKRLVGGVSLSF